MRYKTIFITIYRNGGYQMKLWGGRFTKETNQLVHNFNASLSFDQKFYLKTYLYLITTLVPTFSLPEVRWPYSQRASLKVSRMQP